MGPEGVGSWDISAIAGAAAENLMVGSAEALQAEAGNAAVVEALKANSSQDPSDPFIRTPTCSHPERGLRGSSWAGDEPADVARR